MTNTYKPSTQGCTEFSCVYHGEENRRKAADYKAGREAYDDGMQIHEIPINVSGAWDRGFWDAHADSPDASRLDESGIEDGYGDFLDFDAVSQGMYDDDPSPYAGDYSEM